MDLQTLENTAVAMVTAGKGLLAMDESTPTCGKRLPAVGVENTAENRRAYRTLLLGTPGLNQYISGAILHDETIRQTSTETDMPFPEWMRSQGIIVGIKVDGGTSNLAGHGAEKITEGLDGLRQRLSSYAELQARFCKWRAVITIGNDMPSLACIEANAHALARYAMLCQEASMVPIVEPEVLINGDHSIEHCYGVSVETLHAVFEQLYRQGVAFSGMILKPSMVIAGLDCAQQAPAEQVAELTLRCLEICVPAAVPGIAFLSGGQSEEAATVHLNAMNRLGSSMVLPWRLTFSYARALQQSAMAAWKGEAANVEAARRRVLHRAHLNSLASLGEYDQQMEQEAA